MALFARSGDQDIADRKSLKATLKNARVTEQLLQREKLNLASEQAEVASRIRKEAESASEEIKTNDQTRSAAFSMTEMKRICLLLLDAVKGKNIKSTTVLVDAESLVFSTVVQSQDISLEERSQACSALWNFSFRGDVYRTVIAECRGIEVCMQILEAPPEDAVGRQPGSARKVFCGAIAVLRSLCETSDLIPELIRNGATRKFLDLLYDKNYKDQWATVLHVLVAISQANKDERDRMIKQNLLMYLLGDFHQHQWIAESLIKNGAEMYAVPALYLVESLLRKDALRIYATEKTRAVEILVDVLTNANFDTKAVGCRVITRLCISEACKSALRRSDLHGLVASCFCNTISPINVGSAGAAIGALCCENDVEIAEECWPRICQILMTSMSESPKEDWDFDNFALPGALRATRVFAQMDAIQDLIAKRPHLDAIISVMSKSDSSDVAKADGCHILGSMAMKLQYHSLIMNLNPSPLKVLFLLMRTGGVDQRTSAARALQNLSSGAAARVKIANYTHTERILVNKNTLQEVIHILDILGLVDNVLRNPPSPLCECYAAGILRNIATIHPIREKVLENSRSDPSLICNLCQICRQGTLEARVNAAGTFGNLSRIEAMAVIICQQKVISPLIAMTNLETNNENDESVVIECQQFAMQTLGILAYDEAVVREMIRLKIVEGMKKLISSRSRTTREVTARTLQNLTSFPDSSQAFASNGTLPNAILASLKKKDRKNTIDSLMESLANLAASPSNLNYLINSNSSKVLVNIAKIGSVQQQSSAAKIMKYVACTLDKKLQQVLVNAGAIPALARLLEDGKQNKGEAAELAAGALARFCSVDTAIAAACVKSRGLEGCLSLLKKGSPTAQQQAAKCLIILAEKQEYCELMLHLGGLGAVRDALKGADAETSRLCNMLSDSMSDHPTNSDKPSSLIDRQIIAKMAVLKAQAESIRSSQEQEHVWTPERHETGHPGGVILEREEEEPESDDWGLEMVPTRKDVRGASGSKQVKFAAVSKAVSVLLLPPVRP